MRVARLTTLACALWVIGCSSTTSTVTAAFMEPTGIAVGGAGKSLLFVANAGEDTVQVVQLGAALKDLDLERSPAIYFPLRIPAGASPRALAATNDGAYILALSSVSGSIRLIDANALVPVKRDGNPLELSLADADGQPGTMVASPVACDAPCLGQFYVTQTGRGSVAVVQVQQEAGKDVQLLQTGEINVGGAPVGLAASPSGQFLFIADAAANQVVRWDLSTNAERDRLDIGSAPGPLAVSTDGTLLLVGRRDPRDVLLVSAAADVSMAPIPASPAFVPPLGCVLECSASPNTCSGAHPADAAVCGTGAGLAATAEPSYEAVYLGAIPSAMIALGIGAGQQTLKSTCSSNADEVREYNEVLVVAGVDGALRFVGLRDATGALAPELLFTNFCQGAELTPEESEIQPEQYLTACPAAPDATRFLCVPAGAAGVVVFPGQTREVTYRFEWEAVLPGLDRGTGNLAAVNGERSFFFDPGVDFAELGVKPGDILQITPPAGCTLQACELETFVAGLGEQNGQAGLELSSPIDAECVPDNALAYRIRIGAGYQVSRVVNQSSTIVGRLAPGETFGPGGELGRFERVLFSLASKTPFQTRLTNEVGTPLSACERYELRPQEEALPAVFTRDSPFGFVVNDNFGNVVRAGFDLEADTTPILGTLPVDMALVGLPGADTSVLFVTYSGANALLGLQPFNTAVFTSKSNQRILR